MFFGIWPAAAVTITGDTASWTESTDIRHFCPACGSRLFATSTDGTDVEIRLGALDDAPSMISPGYELFIGRREHWLAPVPGLEQHYANRPAATSPERPGPN